MNEEVQQESNQQGGDLLAVHDLDGTILSVNGALAEYLGYRDPADLLGRNLAEFLAPAERHLLEPRLADIARDGRGRGVLRLLTCAGEERVIEYHNTLRTKGVPRPVVRSVARDVTAAKRQRKILRALYGISQAAFSAPNADSLFAALHGIVGELMPARNFFIAFYDRDHDLLSYPYFIDEHDSAPPPGPLGRGLTAHVIRHGEALLTWPERFAELVERGEVERIGTPALDWLGVPLRTEQLLGVLAVQSYTPGVRFGETEKQVLDYVSVHVAAAIDRLSARQSLRDSEERLRLAVDSAGLTIWDWDLARDLIAATPAPNPQTGDAVATNRTFAQAFAQVLPEDRPRVQRAVAAAIAARGSFREEFRLGRDDGAVVWSEAVGQVHCNADGQPVRVIGTARDITERRHTEAALQRRLDFEKLVAGLSSRFIALSGHQVDEGIQAALATIGEFIGADRSYVFLISPDGARMSNTHEWCAPGIEPEIQNLQRVSMTEYPWFAGFMNRFEVMDVPDVGALPESAAHEKGVFTDQGIQSLISVPMVSRDVLIGCLGFDAVRSKRVWPAETLALLRFVGEMLVNALERRRMEERLQHDALHDGLTGLPNRAALLDRIAQARARAAGRPDYTFAVLYLDLDSFRSVNDSLGHFAGDELLVAVARRLAPVLRPGDTLAAAGGDEFVILLEPVADPIDAERMAQRLREALAGAFTSGAQELFLGAGIGIALSSSGYESPQQILRDAQTALHRAKARGRGRHQIFDQPMHEEARGHFELERDLRGAHERGELLLLYQPIVAVADHSVRGFEALVRWRHPRRGLLLPAQFVPLAEAAGLVMPLGTWILREACAQLRSWQETRPELTMSVNLSPRQLVSPDFEATLLALTAAAPTPRASLHLEITENSLLEENAASVLARLKRRGVQIHLDDFGTGYSSLSYLSRLPIDVLKVDRSFLEDLEHPESLRIVRAIVTLAKDLALGVIVEGLETEAQLDFVRRLGVELAQGNLLGPPADAASAGRLVTG